MPHPYRFTESEKLVYRFTTDNEATYKLSLVDYGPDLLGKDLGPLVICTISLAAVGRPGDQLPPRDDRVGATVKAILAHYFQDANHIAMYVCETMDGRESGRARLFDKWFTEFNSGLIEKHHIRTDFEGFTYYASLLVRKDHLFKDLIVERWFGLFDMG